MGTQEGQLGELGGHSATTLKLWPPFQGHRGPGRGVPAHWTLWGCRRTFDEPPGSIPRTTAENQEEGKGKERNAEEEEGKAEGEDEGKEGRKVRWRRRKRRRDLMLGIL